MIIKPSAPILKNNINSKDSTPSRKRTHLTHSQIASLQASFAINPLPDAAIRHGLSLSLGMTERTVQIWFQNRRAKARKVSGPTGGSGSKSSSALGGNCASLPSSNQVPRYQPTFRSMMTPQLFEEMNAATIGNAGQTPVSTRPSSFSSSQRRPRSDSKPEKPKPTQVTLAPRAGSEGSGQSQQPQAFSESPRTLTVDQSNTMPLPVHLLRIGTWTRFANMTPSDSTVWGLLCYCTKDQLIWQIQAENQQFRIHVPCEAIRQLCFGSSKEDVTASLAQLEIQLDPQQLIFTMCLDNHQWVRCGDFSEQQQASQLFIHEIQGHHDLLQRAVMNMLIAVPELAAKFAMVPSPLLDDLCRDFTLSPSATPEPTSMLHDSSTSMYSNHLTVLDKYMMLEAPFYSGLLSTPYQDGTGHWY
ncbi:hypothetical protein BCR42DRAFT_403677 [Absidia repens]|uniref:Homeobox domain-containing protein n=1 Tax=Absidia repens TaxID=90262 RepID=A0A1X2IV64_9FUNG|nr:hypothetical protein BCR42DRAFT_403677 [Absidia repens]